MCASKKIYIRNNNSGDSPGNTVVMGADVILKNSSYLALNRRHCFWLSLPSITPKVTSADLDLLYWRQDYFVFAAAGTRTRVPSCVILLWMVFQYIYHSTLALSISKTRMRILFYSALVVDNHCKLSWYSVISGHTVLKGFPRGSEPPLSAISNVVESTTQGWPFRIFKAQGTHHWIHRTLIPLLQGSLSSAAMCSRVLG